MAPGPQIMVSAHTHSPVGGIPYSGHGARRAQRVRSSRQLAKRWATQTTVNPWARTATSAAAICSTNSMLPLQKFFIVKIHLSRNNNARLDTLRCERATHTGHSPQLLRGGRDGEKPGR